MTTVSVPSSNVAAAVATSAPALTEFQFKAPTLYADGVTPIPAGTVLAYNLYCDTVNPPVKTYAVPTANVTAAIAGLITVKFTDIGFVPVPGATYYANATDSGAITSAPSNQVTFTIAAQAAAAPSAFTVG